MALRSSLLALLVFALAAPAVAFVDQPISGVSLQLKRSGNGRELLVFKSTDPLALFPSIGGSDDPTTAGVVIELFSPSQPTQALTLAGGATGWTTKTGTHPSYTYRNRHADAASPVEKLLLKSGRQLQVAIREVGFTLVPPTGPIGIRIRVGELRSCALFTAARIVKDTVGRYQARGAVAADLVDCEDTSLGATVGSCTNGSFSGDQCGGECPPGAACGTRDLSTCICIDAAQPCGDTYPVCNGECAVGEECVPTGGFPLTSCGCVPAGSTPCNNSQCGGDCPAGKECNFFQIEIYYSCGCGNPGPCGSGGDDCPPGHHCIISHFGTACSP